MGCGSVAVWAFSGGKRCAGEQAVAADGFRANIAALAAGLKRQVKFAIQINSAPWGGEGCDTASQFIRAALRRGHEIVRVFFYYEGAYNGLRQAMPAGDEAPPAGRWSRLAAEQGVDLVICISAAQRRGVPEGVGLAEGFRVGGLGLWVEACLKADRFLSFGG
jgi:tRNA 2-thiouridine synthesizing protein D